MNELPSSADVVVIGAGIIGCSIAYHLAERGMTDVVVVERGMIGAGATAAAAGGIRAQFSTATNIGLSQLSLEYWESFEERFGVDIAFRQQGYLFILTDAENVDAFRRNVALQRSMGVNVAWVGPEDIRRMHPAISLEGVLGGTFCPSDGWADPATATMGFAGAARRMGVKFVQKAQVTGIDVADARVLGVQVGMQRILSPLVICCAGPQTRALGRLAGLDLPIDPYRRMSFITGEFDQVSAGVPFAIEFERSLYFHPESHGFLFGMSDPSEPTSENTSVDGRWMYECVEALSNRAPVFEDAKVMRGWAGLYEVTPDDNPILGRPPGLEGLIVAAGFSGHGFMHGPAIGRVIAEIALDGEAQALDVTAFRPGRFQEGELLQEHNVV